MPPAPRATTIPPPRTQPAPQPAPVLLERQRQERARHDIAGLVSERRGLTSTLGAAVDERRELVGCLEAIEEENGRWQSPNANLGEIYRLKDAIERVVRRETECHRRWTELGEEIEEKHVEIAFGKSGGD